MSCISENGKQLDSMNVAEQTDVLPWNSEGQAHVGLKLEDVPPWSGAKPRCVAMERSRAEQPV